MSPTRAAVPSTEVSWSDADRAELLSTIEDSTDRLHTTVANLLHLSRLQTDSISPKLDQVGIDDVVSLDAACPATTLLTTSAPQRKSNPIAAYAAAVQITDYADVLPGHRVLHLVGRENKPATMPLTVPVLRVLEARRGERTTEPLILRPLSGEPIDRRDVYRRPRRRAVR